MSLKSGGPHGPGVSEKGGGGGVFFLGALLKGF